ncbi:hypothetical protein [Croceicoccus mobilis]|uniref:Lipoprotein n=1 Tax=Croceicoccus mobilis TaxID=1703339 RepID=A0A916YUL5_9SPHN|nr:hypothetical protein [Croceicoccus mobilis]GGD60493.1 hypothetical protein GCM10010990_07440 [Croceicoccus mobilis]
MPRISRLSPVLGLMLVPLLAACATPAAKRYPTNYGNQPTIGQRVPVPPQQAPAVPASGFRAAPVMKGPGLEGVIGADANALTRLFGTPRLDVWEGDARKLQFSGTRCILDVFLYPPRPGADETASWVEARRSDGRDVDRAACVAAMRRR